MNPLKSISFREPEPPLSFSFRTIITANSHNHELTDDHGCMVASFSFDSYDDFRPPPDREKVLKACRELVGLIALSIVTDRGTKHYDD